jgi:hypothetical protein
MTKLTQAAQQCRTNCAGAGRNDWRWRRLLHFHKSYRVTGVQKEAVAVGG